MYVALGAFLGSMVTPFSARPRVRGTFSFGQPRLLTPDLPTTFNGLFRQSARLSLLRHPIEYMQVSEY